MFRAHQVFLALTLFCRISFAGLPLYNSLSILGNGQVNQNAGMQIKDIMIFQLTGWTGLMSGPSGNAAWPLHWGSAGYVNRNEDMYLWQTYEIQQLNPHMAIAALLMPDAEARVSGFMACWGGVWSSPSNCSGGQYSTPLQLLPALTYAAWMNGLPVVPMISINNYDCFDSSCPGYANRGALVLPKIQQMVNAILAQDNAVFLKTPTGQHVIMLEGLPSSTNLSIADQQAIANYMNSRQDILFIDNLLTMDGSPQSMAGNTFRSAAAEPGTQAGLIDVWGSRYLWSFSGNRGGRSVAAWTNPSSVYPEDVRLWTLDIAPADPSRYPIIISQWNEYGEWLAWEPNMVNGYDNYFYLQWRLSQQP